MYGEKIVYVDMDDVLCNYTESYSAELERNPEIRYPQSQYGFFRNLKPILGSINGIKMLDEDERYMVYILTAPSYKNPLCYSEKREWVERYLGMSFVKRLIISPNKGLNKGDYLIDDNDQGKGQENFEGELIKFGSKKYPDWKAVLDYLVKR